MNIGKHPVIDVDLESDLVSADKSASPSTGQNVPRNDEKMAVNSDAERVARKNLTQLILRQAINRGLRVQASQANFGQAHAAKG